MERRSILKGAGALGAIPVVATAAGGFVYGQPAAAATGAAASSAGAGAGEMLRLSLARTGAPVELHATLARLADFWVDLQAGGATARDFAASPTTALAKAGLGGQLDASDPVVDVMRLSMDPSLKKIVHQLDFRGFMQAMRSRGLITAGRKSAYRKDVQEVIDRDKETFKQTFGTILNAAPHLIETIEQDEQLSALLATIDDSPKANVAMASQRLSGGVVQPHSAVAAAAVVVVIAAAVVIYVSVAAAVTVGITAGFAISVAVSMGVTASGGGGCGGRPDGCPILERIGAHERETRRAAAAAKLLGRPDLAAQTVRADIDSQLSAITQVATEMLLLNIPTGRRAAFDRQLKAMAYKAAGVPV